jgi:hypothetical protein
MATFLIIIVRIYNLQRLIEAHRAGGRDHWQLTRCQVTFFVRECDKIR